MEKKKSTNKSVKQAMDILKKQSTTPVTQDKSVEFQIAAPSARSVSVAGSFNSWNEVAFNLKKDLQGLWKGSVRLKPGKYEYRFFVDGRWTDDPKAKNTVSNQFGTKNAILEVK